MTYQVLARKWRPKTFAELSGQEHVVKALTNALTQGRLHHAYLLTGTRGVGKTTIARILAKSLNCLTGVTATPCGVCAACTEIDAGRFVDLLELDAASNTGIDNMREILDNARYAPTAGRYKVYLIDEVHMLSKAAFNSMLKTLEEPPEHVKFVLATTDPQKIPVTVLSRCLQFNLKQLPTALIAARLATILGEEHIAADAAALTLVARAARGSMRDALSLLDQAIAYGGGEVREPIVRAMLGAVDTDYVYRVLDALIAGDGTALMNEADSMSERSMAFAPALDELASLLHRIAIAQAVPAAHESMDDGTRVADYASAMSPEMVQLAYQICVQGRADLALASDEATGFVMTLLRLLAFAPEDGRAATGSRDEPAGTPKPRRQSPAPAATERSAVVTPMRDLQPTAALPSAAPSPSPSVATSTSHSAAASSPSASAPSQPARGLPGASTDWPAFVASLQLTGIAGQLAAQTELIRTEGRELTLGLPEAQRHLTDKPYVDKLKAALEEATGGRVKMTLELRNNVDVSLAAQNQRERAEQKAQAEAAFRDEPFVRDVLARFDARIKPDSIKPAG